jgi:glycosyltransferase involved in cell wall biosynthesis
MLIGIDASRAFLKRRTGIEEYAYQTIKHLRTAIPVTDSVVLYVRKKLTLSVIPSLSRNLVERVSFGILLRQSADQNDKKQRQSLFVIPEIDFELPSNWRICAIWAPRFWTQIGLSLEMLLRAPNVLFVPAHTVPMIRPKSTVVTVHGLEYEFCPEAYSFWARLYMRFFIRYSCRVSDTVICVSENTKRDVMRLYGVPEEKIRVIYEGYNSNFNPPAGGQISNFQLNPKSKLPISKPYLLFIGRLEERKNIVRILDAFEILKEKYQIPHQLVLVGKPGFGYERIRAKIQDSKFKIHIQELGYVSEEEKWELLRNADTFLFPTLYEGFGIPVLEAQSVGVPVVASNTSSLPEVGGEGAVYVDPLRAESIAEGVQKLLSDKAFRDGIIMKGKENTARFGWDGCASKIAGLLVKDKIENIKNKNDNAKCKD